MPARQAQQCPQRFAVIRDAVQMLADQRLDAGMPAILINQETFAEGFGEGTEDARAIAQWVDGVRIELNPLYKWFDEIVMRRAWNPEPGCSCRLPCRSRASR